ncbi:MAG: DM13 domain-containing protein [Rubrobacteraceae bacterium]
MIGRLIGNKIFWVAFAGGLALLLYLAFAVFGVQAAFLDREVNEDFSTPTTITEETSEEVADTSNTDSTENSPTKDQRKDKNTATPKNTVPNRISAGAFHDAEYEGMGDAIVYRSEDGSYVLRLENLSVENGPDLYVYAVAADDAQDSITVEEAGFVNVGQLKGNRGNQTYELPADFDPEVHRAISIWCQRFSGNFATAPLSLA